MTLPYSGFPFERALKGIRNAGYKYVAWGTSHQRTPIVAVDAPAAEARAVGRKTRDAGLEPVMMFSTVHIEAESAVAAHIRRIKQAAAAGIPFVLTFGKTTPGEYPKFIQNLKGMTSAARDNNVMVLIKQHGGNTATGKDCARVVADVGDERVRICYDAGNVLDYENQDPIPDIRECWRDVRAFAIKDHRNFPKDQDCGPGLGEIDHYKLLAPVINTGLSMPLACENIFEPIVPRPKTAEGIDALAQRAREFLETVIRGLNAAQA
jgi:sugar phosphate isomerase/epimerase